LINKIIFYISEIFPPFQEGQPIKKNSLFGAYCSSSLMNFLIEVMFEEIRIDKIVSELDEVDRKFYFF
jgi:hypothetical protein